MEVVLATVFFGITRPFSKVFWKWRGAKLVFLGGLLSVGLFYWGVDDGRSIIEVAFCGLGSFAIGFTLSMAAGFFIDRHDSIVHEMLWPED